MRFLTVGLLLLFVFVSVTCESYKGAFSQDAESCHPAESNGTPDQTSFDCCNGLPAKSEHKMASITSSFFVTPSLKLFSDDVALCEINQLELSSAAPLIVDRLPVLRL